MSVGWRSTTLNLVAKHCARALDHYERGEPYPRDIFGVGVTAHACLEDLGKAYTAEGFELAAEEGGAERVMRETCEKLIRAGRDFEGEVEPPLPADVVWTGRDLALRFANTAMYAFSGGEYEIGLAVDRHWKLCPYGPGAYFRARIDRMHSEEPGLMDDFDGGGRVLVVSDFKSAWNVDGGPIRLQQKGQAVLAWEMWGEQYESLRVDVVNIRTGTTYPYPILPRDPEGSALLARWRRDIDSTIANIPPPEPDGLRPASPGARCMGCPYLHRCEPAKEAARAIYGTDDPIVMARAYAVNAAFLASFKPLLQEATAEAPIDLGDGSVVGTEPKEQQVLGDNAPGILAAAWNRKRHSDSIEAAQAQITGLLTVLDLSRTNAAKLLAHLYDGGADDRAMRAKVLAQCTTAKTVRRFGVHREGKEDSDGD